MKAPKLEGTFHLDGLIEGPVFSQDDEAVIASFVQQARRHGMVFHLSADGGRFSLLPDTKPVRLPSGAPSADRLISDCMEKWLSRYSPEERNRLMSTLRSVEYLPGREKQSLYGIHPAGKVTIEQRTLNADTIPPAPPPDWNAILKKTALAAAILAVVLAVSGYFVPYREIFARAWRAVRPYDPAVLVVDPGIYGDFLQIAEVALDKRAGMIKLTLAPRENFPKNTEQLADAWKNAADSLPARLALESITRGYLICEFFDEKGVFISHRTCRMLPTSSPPDMFYILIPYDRSFHRVQIK